MIGKGTHKRNKEQERLIMKSYTFLIVFLVILLVIFSSVSCALSFVLPGFQGFVLNKESGKPIENAYVVCFTDYYSFWQGLDPGGGNAFPDSLQVAITDKNGFFKVDSYRKYSGGWADYRRVYIFKEGYIYALQYLQLSEKKNVLRKHFELYRTSKEIPLNDSIKIYLSNNDDKDIDGSPTINGYLDLLGSTSSYHDYFRNSNKAAFKKYKPYFLYLYKIVDKYSEKIIKTFHEPHLVYNWQDSLSRYRESLRLDLDSKEGK